MKKKIVLIDLDDTINKFGETFWNTYNNKFGGSVDHKDVNDWDMSKFAKGASEDFLSFKEPGLFRNIPLKEYAQEFVAKIADKYEVYFVTDSPEGTGTSAYVPGNMSNPLDDKREWIRDHFPNFPLANLIVCSCKWMVEGDVLIDDKPATFEKFRELGKKCILMDAPYNQHIETEFRAKNLKEAEALVDKILEQKRDYT